MRWTVLHRSGHYWKGKSCSERTKMMGEMTEAIDEIAVLKPMWTMMLRMVRPVVIVNKACVELPCLHQIRSGRNSNS